MGGNPGSVCVSLTFTSPCTVSRSVGATRCPPRLSSHTRKTPQTSDCQKRFESSIFAGPNFAAEKQRRLQGVGSHTTPRWRALGYRIRGDHDRAQGRRRRHRPGHHVHLRRGVAERTVRARKPLRSHDPFRDLSFFPVRHAPSDHAARLTPPRSRPRDAQRRDHRERSRQPHDPFLRRLHGHREARRRRREEPGARFWDATSLFLVKNFRRAREPADRSVAVPTFASHRRHGTHRSR